jgi:hypothetical protein
MLQACIGWVATFRFITHAGAVRATGVRLEVICARRVPAKVVWLVDGFEAGLHRSRWTPFPRSGSRPGDSFAVHAKRKGKGEPGQLTMPVAQTLGLRFHRHSRASSAARQCPCGPPHSHGESSSFRPIKCDVDTKFLRKIGSGTPQPRLSEYSNLGICANTEKKKIEEEKKSGERWREYHMKGKEVDPQVESARTRYFAICRGPSRPTITRYQLPLKCTWDEK